MPLPASLARDLLAHRQESAHSDDDDLVFPNRDGGPRDLRNFANRVFGSAARRAGIPEATPHVLRHSYASRMIREGANVKQLPALIGHATHLLDDDLPPAFAEVRTEAMGASDRPPGVNKRSTRLPESGRDPERRPDPERAP